VLLPWGQVWPALKPSLPGKKKFRSGLWIDHLLSGL
jgi:hypothetical protein